MGFIPQEVRREVISSRRIHLFKWFTTTYYNILTVTNYNILQHTTAYYIILQHTTTYYNRSCCEKMIGNNPCYSSLLFFLAFSKNFIRTLAKSVSKERQLEKFIERFQERNERSFASRNHEAKTHL